MITQTITEPKALTDAQRYKQSNLWKDLHGEIHWGTYDLLRDDHREYYLRDLIERVIYQRNRAQRRLIADEIYWLLDTKLPAPPATEVR